MSLIEDWLKFCSGEKNYNASHFYTLFHNDFSQNELNKIFHCFEEKDDLVRRYLNYKAPKNQINDSQLLELIQLDLRKKKDFCAIKGDKELVDCMTDLNYSFVKNEEFKKLKNADLPQVWLMELIGDNQRYSYNNSIKKDALLEAFYGLTSNNNLVWYLAEPIFKSEFDPKPYFEIWKNSGDYILGDKSVYVLNTSDNIG